MIRDRYITFLKETADDYLELYETQAHANQGHNGPYGHIDTPARNTAHWCITFGYLWKNYGDSKYYNVSRKFADYLVDLCNSSASGAVKCMEDDSYNHMNGLMGQAWVIEALVYFFEISNEEKYLDFAKKIFNVPVYNSSQHMWEMVELDGSNIGFDYTFNHQLWFAAVGSLILQHRDDEKIRDQVEDYLDGCVNHLQVHKDGLIKHYGDLSSPFNHDSGVLKWLKRTAKLTLFKNRRFIDPNRYDADGYERGYHLFNLYAFAILKKEFGSHELYTSDKFKAAIEYGRRTKVHNDYFNVDRVLAGNPKSVMNKFAYAYNSPAFEYPFIYYVFGTNNFEKTCEQLFEIQIGTTYDSETKRLSKNNSDPETLTARIYELVRFLEYEEKK